jgi:hypothetical protein
MSVESDPGMWKQISGWLWGILLIPFGLLWRKADNAVSKEEFNEALARQRNENREEHRDFRDTMKELFKNAESDRKDVNRKLETMSREMHEMHVELLNQMEQRAKS